MNVFLTSVIVMAVLHNIPWEKEKNVEVLHIRPTTITIANKKKHFHLMEV